MLHLIPSGVLQLFVLSWVASVLLLGVSLKPQKFKEDIELISRTARLDAPTGF